jgi:hypothetical protein
MKKVMNRRAFHCVADATQEPNRDIFPALKGGAKIRSTLRVDFKRQYL